MLNKNQTLGEFIIKNQTSFKYSSGELSSLINSIRLAAKVVNHEVNKVGLVDIIGPTGEENIQSEKQQKLDVYANEKFINTLINRNIVCGIASEEEETFISINSNDKNNQNKYVVLIDPLDGSSNIDVNGRSDDQLAFNRLEREYKSCLLMEKPNEHFTSLNGNGWIS